MLEVPALAISSTDCRERARRGDPVWYLVPDGVVQYISKHRLYTAGGPPHERPTPPARAGLAARRRRRRGADGRPGRRGAQRGRVVPRPPRRDADGALSGRTTAATGTGSATGTGARASPGTSDARARAGAAPAAPGRTVVARRDRAAARAARRAEARKRNLRILAVVGAVVVVLGAVGWLLFGRGGDDTPVETTNGPPAQQTLLMQVTGVRRDGRGQRPHRRHAVRGHRSRDAGAVAPARRRRRHGRHPLRRDRHAGRSRRHRRRRSPTCSGVRVDDSWVLDEAALAALVDAVGGVQAAVDVDVVRDREGRQRDRRGARRQPASWTARRRPPTRPTSPRTSPSRPGWPATTTCSAVVLAGAAGGPGRGGSAAGQGRRRLAVHARRRPGWPTAARPEAAADDRDLVSDVLPVTEIDTGAGTPSYGIDAAQVAAMMRTRFPGALQKDAGGRGAAGAGRERRGDAGAGGEGARPSWWTTASASSTGATRRPSATRRAP